MSRRCRLSRVCDRSAWAGVGLLIVTAAVVAGADHDRGRYMAQLAAAGLGALWGVRVLVGSPPAGRARHLPRRDLALASLLIVLVVPLLSVPPPVLEAVAPRNFEIFALGLPGWPAQMPFAGLRNEVGEGLGVHAGAWRPIAVVPSDTVRALLLGSAYAVIGALVAWYPWKDRGRRVTRDLAAVLVGLGAVEAVYALLQQSNGLRQIFWFRCAEGTTCTGTFLNRNHFAGLLEMVFPLALANVGFWSSRLRESSRVHHGARWRRHLDTLKRPEFAWVLVWAAAALLLVLGLSLSISRAAFFVTIAGLAAMAALRPHHAHGPGRRRARGALAVVAVIAALWLTSSQVRERLSVSDATRWALAADAVAMIRDFPVFGVGVGNFSTVYPLYRARTVDLWGFPLEHAHNDYLEWLSEVGLPGGVLTALLLWRLGARAVRRLSVVGDTGAEAWVLWGMTTGALALLLHGLTDYNFHVPANALVFACLLGCIIRLTGPPADPRPLAPPVGRDLRYAIAAAGVAACIGWGLVVRAQWRAEAAFRLAWPSATLEDMTAAAAPLEPGAAVAAARRAVALAPRAPRYRSALGRELLRQDGGNAAAHATPAAGEAVLALQRSLWDAPLQPGAMLDLAAALELSIQGDGVPRMAEDLVRRAAALAPYDPEVRLQVADWYLRHWNGFGEVDRRRAAAQVESALSLAARAARLRPQWRATREVWERVEAAGLAATPGA